MKTIAIGKQESTLDLAQAFAAALANEIGWVAENTTTGATVKKEGINIFFEFRTMNTSVYLGAANGYVAAESDPTSYSASKTYNLYVLKSAEGTIAVGHSSTSSYVNLINIIAQNAAGDYVGIALTVNSPYSKSIRGIDTESKSVMTITPVNNSACTSIVKLPDIRGACMFKDLYAVVSCPYASTDRVFCIGGKYYRTCNPSGNSPSIAIPEA